MLFLIVLGGFIWDLTSLYQIPFYEWTLIILLLMDAIYFQSCTDVVHM